jgi:hypothetical protein
MAEDTSHPNHALPECPAWCTTDHRGPVYEPVHWTAPEMFDSIGEHGPAVNEQVRVQGSVNNDEVPAGKVHVDTRLGDADRASGADPDDKSGSASVSACRARRRDHRHAIAAAPPKAAPADREVACPYMPGKLSGGTSPPRGLGRPIRRRQSCVPHLAHSAYISPPPLSTARQSCRPIKQRQFLVIKRPSLPGPRMPLESGGVYTLMRGQVCRGARWGPSGPLWAGVGL